MKRIICALAILLASQCLYAKSVQKQIYMNNIQVNKTVEDLGDELYIMVTELNSKGTDRQFSIPTYPITWPSESIEQINNLMVWEGDLPEGESTEVIIELIEQDAPPFNVDDSLGSVRLKMKNHKGKILTEWGSFHDTSTHEGKNGKYTYYFKGHGGKYTAEFEMTDVKREKPHPTGKVKSSKK